jgi:hypothetical protein
MTPHEAFQFGFLARCTDELLSAEETVARAKTAVDLLEKRGFWKELANTAYGLTTAGMLGAIGVGAGGGYLAAKATEPEADVEDEKRRELMQAYQLQAERVRQARARRGFRQPRPEFMLTPR